MTWTTRPRSEVHGVPAIVAGSGPVLLLLHGVGLRAEAWAPVIDALSGGFTVIAPDMPGHGENTSTNCPAALAGYSDLVAPLLEKSGVIVGHSMGAMIALDLAARYPEKVRGVAALNAVFERSTEAKAAVQARAASLDGVSMADPAQTLDRWFGPEVTPERAACRDWLGAVDPAGYKAAYTIFAAEDGPSRRALAGLTCPVLFMTGALEPNSTPEMSRAMAALTPLGRAQVVASAAHMMPMTHADETVAALRDLAKEALS